jgi:hypothetical protein
MKQANSTPQVQVPVTPQVRSTFYILGVPRPVVRCEAWRAGPQTAGRDAPHLTGPTVLEAETLIESDPDLIWSWPGASE